jgi:hypothetical protein
MRVGLSIEPWEPAGSSPYNLIMDEDRTISSRSTDAPSSSWEDSSPRGASRRSSARGAPRAFAQGTELYIVRWVDFIPEADVDLKRQAPEASRALGAELMFEIARNSCRNRHCPTLAHSFHGSTSGAGASTFIPSRRAGYGPTMPGTFAIPVPDCYRARSRSRSRHARRRARAWGSIWSTGSPSARWPPSSQSRSSAPPAASKDDDQSGITQGTAWRLWRR